MGFLRMREIFLRYQIGELTAEEALDMLETSYKYEVVPLIKELETEISQLEIEKEQIREDCNDVVPQWRC